MSDVERGQDATDTTASGGVLVAVDGSETSERSLLWAAREAARRGAPLTVVHCYYWPSSGLGAMDAIGFLMDGLAKDSAEILNTAESTVRRAIPDLDVHVESHLGAPVATIVDLTSRFDVVVVGSRGLGGFKGMLLGSVSTGVVANALCTAVVVRGETDLDSDDVAPVVVGVDASNSGQAALAEAFAAAERRSCALVVVHAWQAPSSRASAEQIEEWQRSAAADVATRVAPLAERHPSVAVQTVTFRDRPTAALLARAQTARLVVVGTRGRSELTGALLGSTSRAMVHHSPCPVMVVR
jgi:nucleotide-binding universal stress UspA family protein